MKKITLTLASMLSLTVWAQTQRTVLLEEFTQASCMPCAKANPPFNKLITENSSKVVSIKYQISWPGDDPMNEQNKTEVDTRVKYYKLVISPHVSTDGGATIEPQAVTNVKIDNAYAIPSPFKLELTEEINTAKDTIHIECTITATQPFVTKGLLYARFALVEKVIKFAKAPGENGEKEFYNVMRKMFPSATGTSLPLTWENGQTQKISIKAAIPAYIYDKDQLSVVGFLQTDIDKAVLQAIEKTVVTGIVEGETATNGRIHVYPNPMTDAATVGIHLFQNSKVSLQVVNALGQTVISNDFGKLNSGEQTYELTTAYLSPGLYFLNVFIGSELITKKISITKN